MPTLTDPAPFPNYRDPLDPEVLRRILDGAADGSSRASIAESLGWTQIRLQRVIRRYSLSSALDTAAAGHSFEVVTDIGAEPSATVIRWEGRTQPVHAIRTAAADDSVAPR